MVTARASAIAPDRPTAYGVAHAISALGARKMCCVRACRDRASGSTLMIGHPDSVWPFGGGLRACMPPWECLPKSNLVVPGL